MKYFTRDLYRRCRSTDETVLNAACEEWEQANEAYERHLAAIEPELPPQIREFSALLLRDAEVQSIAQDQEDTLLILVLHKKIPPQDLVILCYDLDEDPIIEPFSDAPKDWTRPTTLDFDELDIVNDTKGKVYSQSIVFGNGWLMRLRFHDVGMTVAKPIYPIAVGNS